MNNEQQRVLVVGGSSGIGLGIARAVLARGGRPTLVGRSAERLEEARRGLDETGERVATVVADATREDDVARLFAGATFHHVALTAVAPYYAGIRQLDLGGARSVIESKLVAALLVAKHARIEAGGSLLLTSGVAADRPGPGGSVVAAVNGALEALVRALSLELAPVRVNALSPGWVDTPVWDALAGSAKEGRFAAQAQKLPVGRVGHPDDLARAALFLFDSGFTTGETLHVDGGHRLV